MSEAKKYKRQEKAKDDKKQSRFDAHGWLQPKKSDAIITRTAINPNEAVICPFCLYKSTLANFFVMGAKGIMQGKAQCPDCKNGMLMKTLLEKRDAEKYAEFVFNYRRSGYWKKCPFETWKNRLVELGWTGKFWIRYKALRGDAQASQEMDAADDSARRYEDEYAHYEEV